MYKKQKSRNIQGTHIKSLSGLLLAKEIPDSLWPTTSAWVLIKVEFLEPLLAIFAFVEKDSAIPRKTNTSFAFSMVKAILA